MGSDNIPSLASLRRGAGRKRSAGQHDPASRSQPDNSPSLFDLFSEPAEPLLPPTAADVIAEQSRALYGGATDAAAVPPQPKATKEPEAQVRSRVWSVGALVREVRGLVEKTYGLVTVEGEISNWRPAGSGHCYFTLKDGDAQLSAVMFRRNASLLRFRPKDGDAIRLRGQISVYENRGQMQLIAESMELAGQGALLATVQALKEKLKREGLFERKRPLPAFPKCIGVVTSLQGAALRDIVKVCRRRHAAVNLLIYPAAVQGPRCSAEVIAGLRWFNRHKDRADVVIVARGGGSWEDLHGFDDEGVARAIAGCELPVISGIGHATDTTIADAAADVCAPTPSAAAELVTAAHHRVEERVERLRARVLRAGRYEVLRYRQRLMAMNADSVLRRLVETMRRREQRLDEAGFAAEAAIERALRTRRDRLDRVERRLLKQYVGLRLVADKQRLQTLSYRMNAAASRFPASRGQQIAQCESRLKALSPLRVLERGYALVYAPGGALLRRSDGVKTGDVLSVRVSQGSLQVSVRSSDAELKS